MAPPCEGAALQAVSFGFWQRLCRADRPLPSKAIFLPGLGGAGAVQRERGCPREARNKLSPSATLRLV